MILFLALQAKAKISNSPPVNIKNNLPNTRCSMAKY